jgi:hypothetical protein
MKREGKARSKTRPLSTPSVPNSYPDAKKLGTEDRIKPSAV